MAYIPFEKMKSLREAAKNGDDRAKSILRMQMDGEDYSRVMDDYFAQPKAAPTPAPEQSEPKADYSDVKDEKLAKFLQYNGVRKGDPEYEDTIETYYKEFPKARLSRAEETEDEFAEADTSDVVLPDDGDGDAPSIYDNEDEQIPDDDAVAPQAEEKDCVDELIADEYEAIDGYDKAISEISKMDLGDAAKRGVIADLEEIRKDEYEHVEKLKRLKSSIKKEPTAAEAPQGI